MQASHERTKESEGLTEQEIQNMKKDPKVKKLLLALFADTVQGDDNQNNTEEQGKPVSNSGGKRVIRHKVLPDKIKSPSDTTLYAPALRKQNSEKALVVRPSPVGNLQRQQACTADPDINPIDQISNFVESMRMEADHESGYVRQQLSQDMPETSSNSVSRKKADELLIGAEQFKATVAQPKGNPHVFEQFAHDHDSLNS